LAPPKPNELIPTTTGWSGNGSHFVCTCMGQPSKSISGLGTWKLFDVGTKVRCLIIRTTLSRAQWKAAASMCPRLLFTLETRSGTSRSLLLKASAMALPSMGSPTAVPVAWASI